MGRSIRRRIDGCGKETTKAGIGPLRHPRCRYWGCIHSTTRPVSPRRVYTHGGGVSNTCAACSRCILEALYSDGPRSSRYTSRIQCGARGCLVGLQTSIVSTHTWMSADFIRRGVSCTIKALKKPHTGVPEPTNQTSHPAPMAEGSNERRNDARSELTPGGMNAAPPKRGLI